MIKAALKEASKSKVYTTENVFDRAWNKTKILPTGCWIWFGYRDKDGYALFKDENNKTVRLHRWIYELLVGPIEDGLVTDHLCRVRCCLNPSHIEVVSVKLNTIRGVGITAKNSKKTYCKRGHKFEETNIYWVKGRRSCRICLKLHYRNWYLRNKKLI